jgi:hypothetical protein
VFLPLNTNTAFVVGFELTMLSLLAEIAKDIDAFKTQTAIACVGLAGFNDSREALPAVQHCQGPEYPNILYLPAKPMLHLIFVRKHVLIMHAHNVWFSRKCFVYAFATFLVALVFCIHTKVASTVAPHVRKTAQCLEPHLGGGVCSHPIIYSVCGDDDIYHSMAVASLLAARAQLDAERRKRARLVLVASERVASDKSAKTPGIEFLTLSPGEFATCGINASVSRDWIHARIPALQKIASNSAFQGNCIMYLDADAVPVRPLQPIWQRASAFADTCGRLSNDIFFACFDGFLIRDQPAQFRARFLWQAWRPRDAASVSYLPDLNSGIFLMSRASDMVNVIVSRFCAAHVAIRKGDSIGQLPKNVIDQPLLSFVVGNLTDKPYERMDLTVITPAVRAFVRHSQIPPREPNAIMHMNGDFGKVGKKIRFVHGFSALAVQNPAP